MGPQFENLIVNHFREILPHLHLGNCIVVSAAPYRNQRKSRGGGFFDAIVPAQELLQIGL